MLVMRPIMSAGTGERSLERAASNVHGRSDDIRLALLLTYITLGWMTVEGAAALLLGWASKSLLLEAFGIDSVIELFSASVLLWRLRVEASGRADETRVGSSYAHRDWWATRSICSSPMSC